MGGRDARGAGERAGWHWGLRGHWVAVALVALGLTGCPGFGDQSLAEIEGITEVPTWHTDVEPIMISYCQPCHRMPTVAGAPFPLLTLAQVRSHADRIVVRAVQLGDMPPGGGGIPDEKKAILSAWVSGGMPEGEGPTADAGADAAPQDAVVPRDAAPVDAAPADAAAVDAVVDMGPPPPPPTWDADIGPLFRASCTEGGCHDMRGLSAALSLTSYAGFLAGGQTGVIHGDGNPARALLIDRLRGRNGLATMPLGRTPRPEAEIALIEAWIGNGFPEN